MKVLLFGASGMIGSAILAEALARGHQVTAAVRNPDRVVSAQGVTVVQGDIGAPAQVSALAPGYDAVVNATNAHDDPQFYITAARTLLAGLAETDVRRLVVVGGAGSLEAEPGLRLVDTPTFPAAWRPLALAHAEALEVYRAADLDWTYFSPAALIEPGPRHDTFRVGGTQLLRDEHGQSRITTADYAVALLDELERPQHLRQQMTAAY